MLLNWVLAAAAVLSACGGAGSLVYVRSKLGIDRITLDKMRREEDAEQRQAEEERKVEEERRERQREESDQLRSEVMRKELNALTLRSNARFDQWQEAVADLDDLWAVVEDDLLPWIREAYARLTEAKIDMPRPPTLKRRRLRAEPH